MQGWQVMAEKVAALQQGKRPFEIQITQAKTRLEQKQKALTATAQRVKTANESQTKLTQIKKNSQARLAQLEIDLAKLSKQIEQHHAERAKHQQMVGKESCGRKNCVNSRYSLSKLPASRVRKRRFASKLRRLKANLRRL